MASLGVHGHCTYLVRWFPVLKVMAFYMFLQNVISYEQQIQYLREYQSRLQGIVGPQEASRIISESLYYIGTWWCKV